MDKQWTFLKRQLDQMRGMGQWLRNAGMLPAQGEAPDFAAGFIEALNARPARARPARARIRSFPPTSSRRREPPTSKGVLSGRIITTRERPGP